MTIIPEVAGTEYIEYMTDEKVDISTTSIL